MRNLLAFDLSKRIEMPYTPAGRPVNVFLNGEYKGCYQLCDHIDVRKNRVDVKEMKPTDISGENLTGGYFVEIDAYAYTEDLWFTSKIKQTPVTIKSPDSEEIVSQQTNYIKNHFNLFEASVFESTFSNPVTGFRKYLDTETFIRHFLVGEISGNTDTYWSVYLYKQRGDDKFYVGPVWDFDIAYENDYRTYPINTKSNWIYLSGSDAQGMKAVINRLLSDPELYKEIKNTYSHYRDNGTITKAKLLEVIDNYALEINASQILNFKRWIILNSRIHMNFQALGSYSNEVNFMKKYVQERIDWMDRKLNYVPAAISNIEQPTAKIWTETGKIHIDNIVETTSVEIFDWFGKIIYKRTTDADLSIPTEKGVYIVRLNVKNSGNRVTKCIVK
jgi:hypothetical protein